MMEKLGQSNNIIKIWILELEDKLMDLIEICLIFEDIPIPVFEHEMSTIFKEIEHLEKILD